MKVKLEIVDNVEDECVILRTKTIDSNIQRIQEFLSKQGRGYTNLLVYQEEEEVFLPVSAILFLETDEDGILVHTSKNVYLSKDRLYSLEEKLPDQFMRVSKSTILNCDYVFSVQRNITASSRVTFMNSEKDVYVSRMYYKMLKIKMQERSF